jgi:DNA excision repair protein ERCC-6-like 2
MLFFCCALCLLSVLNLLAQSLPTRPAFPLKPSQTLLGPLVLDLTWVHAPSSSSSITTQEDDGHGGDPRPHAIAVPGCINTHLRDYQRTGVRFFWERYREGRGGLLGDDMGLVRVSSRTRLRS